MAIKLTNNLFIEKALKIFPEYDYSKTLYINTRSKVLVICNKHGLFEKLARELLKGSGCPKCSYIKQSLKFRDTKELFIDKAIKIHGNKYTYDKLIYVNQHTKVIVTCPKHGDFEITPNNLLNGKGCSKCYAESKCLTTLEFIEKAIQVHGNKYDYSKVNYIKSDLPIEIICNKHGSFYQTPNSHLQNRGCPKCSLSKGEKFIERILNEFNINYIPLYKITINKTVNSSGVAYIDFYLPDYNIFIEYNGIQHYVPIKLFGGEIAFEHLQKRDSEILNYCKNNSINLLEIKYTMSDSDIKEILINLLNRDN